MFVIVGSKARDQVVILHHMLSKTTVKARPSVLWCYKKELGFSTHRKKRMRQLQKKIKSGKLDVNEEDPFELFIAATNIRYCYYHETHKILGNTYGMLVLQDFEAMTANTLARTVETIKGGGLVLVLLQSIQCLRQLYTMTMDVHARYRTEAHQEVVGRFNERFILSLGSCDSCLVLDDQLNILPISSAATSTQPSSAPTLSGESGGSQEELVELQMSLQDTPPLGLLVAMCSTCDQARALLKCCDAIAEQTLRTMVAVTSARGRGKSAALGLALSAAVAFGYSNLFVTAPSPENLKTLFEFLLKGLEALKYEEHQDYEVCQGTQGELQKCVVRVSVFRGEHRQTVQYVHPCDSHLLGLAELLVIDEAAAIPLPLVQKLLGPYLVFLASTINGYEGTGRSLSLKLIGQLREHSITNTAGTGKGNQSSLQGRTLQEVSLNESIRYRPGDSVEQWLNQILCLEACIPPARGCPPPSECQLFYVNRDTLFSYHRASEAFLQQVVSLYVSSHYKNSPNDLQMLADAPAHHLFVLLAPVSDPNTRVLPQVLCVMQVCYEGCISKATVSDNFTRGRRAAGDLIPWTVSQQFQDEEFPSLAGARIVRIATHPEYQRMGYGQRALELLSEYYMGRMPSLEENGDHKILTCATKPEELPVDEIPAPRASLPPLLLKLSERRAERLDYLGVSYGLTPELLRFWRKAGYVPVYMRQTPNDLTGEHSCIMLKCLQEDSQWLPELWKDFRRRFTFLLGYQFRGLKPSTALALLKSPVESQLQQQEPSAEEIGRQFTVYDMKRLELYSQNLVDHHLITDLLPSLAQMFFLGRLALDVHLSAAQSAILLGLGLQHHTVDVLAKELDLPTSQLLGLFNRVVRKFVQCLRSLLEKKVEESLPCAALQQQQLLQAPLAQSLAEELSGAAREMEAQQKRELKKLQRMDLSQYSIKGSESEWQQALIEKASAKSSNAAKKLVSIKSISKRTEIEEEEPAKETRPRKKKKQRLSLPE